MLIFTDFTAAFIEEHELSPSIYAQEIGFLTQKSTHTYILIYIPRHIYTYTLACTGTHLEVNLKSTETQTY